MHLKMEITLVQKTSSDLIPTRNNQYDAGLDLKCSQPFTIFPDEIVKVPTGVCINIPPGKVGYIMSRSGLSTKGIVVLNAPGVIDSGYTGEICVVLMNFSDHTQQFNRADRIAQLVVQSVDLIELVVVDKLETKSARGDAGFGSSGLS